MTLLKWFMIGLMFFFFGAKSFSETDESLARNIFLKNKIVYSQEIFMGSTKTKYYCFIQKIPPDSNSPPREKIFFYSGKNKKLDPIGSYEYKDEYFGHAFFIYYNHAKQLTVHFVTVWDAGAGIQIHVYGLDTIGKMQMIFESEGRSEPEVMDDKLILGQWPMDSYKETMRPHTANIYKWNGTTYILFKQALWGDRFK